jgi:spore coat protein H
MPESPVAAPTGRTWQEECEWSGYGPEWAAIAEPPATDKLEIFVDEPNLNELFFNRSLWSDEPVFATYRLNDSEELIVPSEPSLRFRGNTSRVRAKKSLKIEVGPEVNEPALEDVNLNAMYIDPTFLRERMSFEMYRQLGLMAPKTSYTSVFINGEYEGLFVNIEDVDGSFFREYGSPGSEWITVRPNRSISRDFWQTPPGTPSSLESQIAGSLDARGETEAGEVQELLAWLRAKHQGTDAADAPAFDDMFDREYFLKFFAVASLIQDIDSLLDDFWLVRETTPGSKWKIVPWDKDLVMGAGWVPHAGENSNMEWNEDVLPGQSSWVSVVLQDAELKAELYDTILKLGRGPLGPQFYCSQLYANAPVISELLEAGQSETAFPLYLQESFLDPRDGGLEIPLELRHLSLVDYANLRFEYLETIIEDSALQPGVATRSASASSAGKSLYFTDSEGFTIGRLDVTEVITPGDITMRVVVDPTEEVIDRRWFLDFGESDVRGKLSIYFRDKPGSSWFLPEIETDRETNAFQLQLTAIAIDGDKEVPLETTINPLTNRITIVPITSANVEIVVRPLEGAQSF